MKCAAPDATLEDPALREALAQVAMLGRLSDEEVRAMRKARRRTGMAGAAALALAVGLGLWHQNAGTQTPQIAHYETQRGQRMSVRLADGSRLQLDGATSIDVSLGQHERHAALQKGETWFDIAHEPDRPFTVEAGGSVTQVLGTAFDIDLAHRDVKLAVYRGAVRFASNRTGRGVTVHAGWRSRFSQDVAGAPSRFDITQQDWRQDWLDTDDMRLGDLVDTLNRRGGPIIAPPPDKLADLKLAGRFKLDGSAQLLGAIGTAYGFRLERDGDLLRLVPEEGAATKVP
ncbi:MAG: FecR domain-containing protein [Sphingomonadales bacterium]|nr:FecR domain-containing protein [Sphingomonadales bacterium]MDE2170746.1 FecR domain-containing protein [Sphingomonadales bacterium]